MTTLPLSARLGEPALIMRRMQRHLVLWWYKELLPLILYINPPSTVRIQVILLLVIIPSILAGVLVAQTAAQIRMPLSR